MLISKCKLSNALSCVNSTLENIALIFRLSAYINKLRTTQFVAAVLHEQINVVHSNFQTILIVCFLKFHSFATKNSNSAKEIELFRTMEECFKTPL